MPESDFGGSSSSQAFRILKAPALLAAGALTVISTALGSWAVTAKIPVIVNGIGIMNAIDGLFSVDAPSAGEVIYPFSGEKGAIRFSPPDWSEEAYQYLYSNANLSDKDLYKLITKTIKSLNELESKRVQLDDFSSSLEDDSQYNISFKQGDIIAFVENSASKVRLIRSLFSLSNSIRLYQGLRIDQKDSLGMASDAALAQQGMLSSLEELVREGVYSKAEYLREQAQASSLRGQVTSSQASLNDAERQIEQNRAELRSAYADFLRDSAIFAKDQGYVSSFIAPQWSDVQPGQQLMILSWNQQVAPHTIPVFVNQLAASQITKGNDIISTPLGFSAAEVGGITGKIVNLSTTPLTANQLVRRLGSEGIATSVSSEGAVYQLNVKLARDKLDPLSTPNNRGGYVWNNRSNPPVAPRQGMIMGVQIITRQRTPLEMLIPAVREWIGMDTPERFRLLDLNQGGQ